MKRMYLIPALLCGLMVGLWQFSQSAERQDTKALLHEPIRPIPRHIELDERKIALGDKLFHDPQLSHDDTIACTSCHGLQTGGTDNKVRSLGLHGAESPINTPTVFNSGFNFRQFWDGRAETLEAQIDGPIHNPKEMGSNWQEIITKLKNAPDYVTAFNALYPDGIQSQNIKDALATFERSLYTPNARFDQYLRGDSEAISDAEKAGYARFKSVGCIACHQGIGVGGNMFQIFGVMRNYFADRGNITPADLGRFTVTGDDQDRHVFKVPSLRNVAVTPPYLHDGSVKRLEDMVATMAKYQLGRKLKPKEIDLIAKFLRTLTGEYKGKPLTLPKKVVQTQ